MTRAFGQTQDEWAGVPSDGELSAYAAAVQRVIDAAVAQGRARVEEQRDELAAQEKVGEEEAARIQKENEAAAAKLQADAEQSDAEYKQFQSEHESGAPKTSDEAKAKLDELSGNRLTIYNEFVNQNKDTLTSSNDAIAAGGSTTIDPTEGLSDLSDEEFKALQGEDAKPYDPFKDVPKGNKSDNDSDSSSPSGAKASLVHLDMDLLRDIANNCTLINDAFQKKAISQQRDAWEAGTHDCLGYNAGKVNKVIKNFYENWKHRREKIAESAEQFGKNARTVELTFTRFDVDIAARAMYQHAVTLESKRRALLKSEEQERAAVAAAEALRESSSIDESTYNGPVLELNDVDVKFIGGESFAGGEAGIVLTGGLLGQKRSLWTDSSFAEYSEAAGEDFMTGDYTPEFDTYVSQYLDPLGVGGSGDSDHRESLPRVGAGSDSLVAPGVRGGPAISDIDVAFDAGSDDIEDSLSVPGVRVKSTDSEAADAQDPAGGIGALLGRARTFLEGRGVDSSAADDVTLHAVLAGPRGMVPRPSSVSPDGAGHADNLGSGS